MIDDDYSNIKIAEIIKKMKGSHSTPPSFSRNNLLEGGYDIWRELSTRQS